MLLQNLQLLHITLEWLARGTLIETNEFARHARQASLDWKIS